MAAMSTNRMPDKASDDSEASLLSGKPTSGITLAMLPLRKGGASPMPAMANLVKSLLGAGILSVANAFAKSGLVWGIILYLLVGVGVTGGNLALIAAKHELNKRGRLDVETFSEVGGAVFGPWGSFIVSAQVVFLELAFCAGFVVVILDQLHVEVGLPTALGWRALASIGLAVPLALLANIRWLKDLWLVSVFGLLVYVVGIVGLSVYESGVELSQGTQPPDVTPTASGLVLFVGVAVYANEGINLVLPVETTLSDRSNGYWVTAVGMLSYNTMCAAMGALAFSAGLGECGLITDCFTNATAAAVVRWALVIALLASHPLQLYPASEILERGMGLQGGSPAPADAVVPEGEDPPESWPTFWKRVSLRCFLALVTCLLGSLVPDFPLLADIIGNLVMTLVGFVLPVALYTALFWRTMPWYAWVLGALSVVFGLVTCVFGTIASVEHLIANI